MPVDGAPAEIHLELECLQPIGSFKLRGAADAVAAALGGAAGRGKVVCVVSGGNIDPAQLVVILAGQLP